MMEVDEEDRTHFAFHPKPIISPTYHTESSSEILDLSYETYSTTATPSELWYPPPTPQRNRTETNKKSKSFNSSICSDRYIPSRESSNFQNMNLWDNIAERSVQIRVSMNHSSYNANSDIDSGMMDVSTRSMPDTSSNGGSGGIDGSSYGSGNNSLAPQLNTFATQAQQNLLGALLRTEVFGENIDPSRVVAAASGDITPFSSGAGTIANHLRFTNSRRHLFNEHSLLSDPAAVVNAFSLTPMNNLSERLITTPRQMR